MPGKPYKSRLSPYENFIRKSRNNGITYKEIVAELKSRYGLTTSINSVFSFVKVRSKKRKVISMLEADNQIEVRKTFSGIVTREKQISISKEKPKGKFHYNPDEPIT